MGTEQKIDLTECSDQELSLQVYNDEHLYNLRYDPFDDLKQLLKRRFLFTGAQLVELLEDVHQEMTEDLRQMWEANHPGGWEIYHKRATAYAKIDTFIANKGGE